MFCGTCRVDGPADPVKFAELRLGTRVTFMRIGPAGWLISIIFLPFCAKSAALAWQQPLDEEIEWSRLTFAGTLLVAGERQLVHIDPRSGSALWVREDLPRLAQFNVRDVPGTSYLVINAQTDRSPATTRLQVVNIGTGRTIWDTGDMGGTALGAYPLAKRNLLVSAANLNEEGDSKAGLYVTARSMDSGEVVWKTMLGKRGSLPVHSSDVGGFLRTRDFSGHPPPVITEDTFILVAGDLIALDLASGEEKWRFKLKASNKTLKGTYAQPMIVGDTLYAVGRSSLHALDLATGTEKWKAKLGNAPIPQIEAVGNLIIGRMGGTFSDSKDLVQAKPFGAFAVDTATGKLAWKWTKARDSITNLHVLADKGLVLLADKKKLYALKIDAGKRGEVVYEQDLEFKRKMGAADVAAKGLGAVGGFLGGGIAGGLQGLAGGGDRGDPPLDIQVYGDQAIVRAQYHVLAHDIANRETDWSIQFAPPGMSPFALIAMGAVTATMVAGSADAHSASSWNTMDSAMMLTNSLQDAIAARYGAAEAARNLSFFLTTEEEGLALVGIDLTNGEEVGRIPMDEKEPQFMVDAIANRVYHFWGGLQIRAYDF